jgi:FkbM family methyltransferase
MARLSSLARPEYAYRPVQIVRRALWATSGGSARLVPLPWGVSIEVWPEDRIGAGLGRTGVHELPITELIMRTVDPAEVVVDVGANIGYFTSLMATAVGPQGSVLALEPHPEVCGLLRRNAARWGAAVQVKQVAASDFTGRGELVEGPDFRANRGTASLGAVACGHPTETTLLDDLLAGQAIGLIKLDIEGHEGRALVGATRLLQEGRVRDLVIEEQRPADSDAFRLLRQHGYEIFGVGARFSGIELVSPLAPAAIHRWVAPTFVATLDPRRLVDRCRSRGWQALQPRMRRRARRRPSSR